MILRTVIVLAAFCSALFAATPPCRAEGTPQAALKSVVAKLETLLTTIDADLGQTAVELSGAGLGDATAHEALTRLLARHPYAQNAATVNATGHLALVVPDTFGNGTGADVSGLEQVRRLLATGKPVVSGLYLSHSGMQGIDFLYPIFRPGDGLEGAVSLFASAAFFDRVFRQEEEASGYDFLMLEQDGDVVYFSADEDADRDAPGGEEGEPTPTLRELPVWLRLALPRILSTPAGVAAMPVGDSSDDTQDVAWTSVRLWGTAWRVVSCNRPSAARFAAPSLPTSISEMPRPANLF